LGRERGQGLVDLDSLTPIRFQLFGMVFLNHFNWLPPPDGFLLGSLHFPSGWWWTHRQLAGQPA